MSENNAKVNRGNNQLECVYTTVLFVRAYPLGKPRPISTSSRLGRLT